MPMPSGKMNQREREIGARLREFRTRTHWPQTEFGKVVGLTRDQLASIEGGRTPLRYDQAWRIRISFNLNFEWLAWNRGDVCSASGDDFPAPESGQVGARALFTDVADLVARNERGASSLAEGADEPLDVDLASRLSARRRIEREMEDWLAQVPTESVLDLAKSVIGAGQDFVTTTKRESEPTIAARREALDWDRIRRQNASRFVKFAEMPSDQKRIDADVSSRQSDSGMTKLESLLCQIDEVLGSDSAARPSLVAKLGGVSRQQLNDWLSRRFKPNDVHARRS